MSRNNPSHGVFSMGEGTHCVPMELFSTNRRRLMTALQGVAPANSFVFLQGGSEQGICSGDSSDVGPIFKQESYFHWTFGVLEPDVFGSLCLTTGASTLFIPKLPKENRIWNGVIPTPEETKNKYLVDAVFYTEDLLHFFPSNATLLLLHGVNSDSNKITISASFEGMTEKYTINKSILYSVISETRVIKTESELNVLRYAAQISSEAHKALMRRIVPGMKEYEAEAFFRYYVYSKGGHRHVCYNCICGSGPTGSILHYGHAGAPNDRVIESGDMVLFDMGGEYYRYCSDITASYPVNGVFSEKQKLIYSTVLSANRAVMKAAKPDVSWLDLHLLSNRVLCEGLLKGGLLRGSLEEMMSFNLCGRVFQPHGLGHFLGVDVHDVGGYLEGHPSRPLGLGLKNLRTSRILKENMVLTIEPGIYFIDFLLDEALKSKELKDFLVPEEIEKFRGFGGVRIEDDVIITKTGVELMSLLPRTIEEIENWMSGKDVDLKGFKS